MRAWIQKKMKAFRMWRSVRMLVYISRYCPEILTGFIAEKASDISLKTTMAYVEQQGFMHCSFCPTRFGLRHVGKFLVCGHHAAKAQHIEKAA